MKLSFCKGILTLSVLALWSTPRVSAAPIKYTDIVYGAEAASLGSTTFTADANLCCVYVTVTFFADTTTAVPFSVTGAHGGRIL
jgi:hypothetical protein